MQSTPPDRISPTDQTAANREDDPLQQMVDAGLVDSKGEEAANEIKNVFLAICRDALLKGGMGDGTARGRYEIPDDLAAAHARRYLPWVRAHPAKTINLTLHLVVERLRLPDAEASSAVANALRNYARRIVGERNYYKKKRLTDSRWPFKRIFKQPELCPQHVGFFCA